MKPFGSITSLALCSLALLAGCGEEKPVPSGEREAAATPQYEKGPHGGRLLSDTGMEFQAEVTIYERGVPPRFRVYLYDGGKPVPPAQVSLRIELHRLGGRVDRIGFKPDEGYLVSDEVVAEPHSFDVKVAAARGTARYAWEYSQTEGRVELSDDAVRTSAIGIETAGPRVMRSVLEMPGEIALNGDKVTHVVPRMSGVIREIRKNQGQDVRKGEVIAVLDSSDLAEVKREFLETEQQAAFARTAFEREERLWKRNIASEASYEGHERAYHEARLKHQSARQRLEALGIRGDALAALDGPGNTLTRYELHAPFDGVLVEKKVAVGQAVEAHDDLFTFADLSSVWVTITVYAKDLNTVKEGQEVTVAAAPLGLTATGRISYVGSLVGAETRSAQARVALPNPGRQWRAGLFVTVAAVREEVAVPVAVKREGLQKFRDWDVVFIRSGEHFEARPLELGREDGDWVEVLSGLSAGERYASKNSFILKADVGKTGASHDH